ncbi:LysR family transcriptional regulator [Jeongeupia naejangsanensis]|uniref:LysR family transcriptional regulator n=1 Tax=Jeongeupia naejangsanensis TaxID=613195 RepID=A0ABS2BJR3_9NEIS|nr:LysR family transcriptional regulator [Jeongeupia naejangsanensis]MBM3115839.1 LysR family transcriptional regulator [Jeongeupia naejangsanensis]
MHDDYLGLLPDMAVFVRVVEAGSFSAAARQLGTTPSAVSRQIGRLENALGARLLERTTRKLRLSEPGRAVLTRAQDMVSAARAVMAVPNEFMEAPRGLVRISIPNAFGRQVVHPTLPAFLARYPEVDIQLVLTDRDVDPFDDDVDLVLRLTETPPPGLAARPLLRIQHVLAATPAYLAEHGTPAHPRELARHSCIYLGETPDDARWQFKRDAEVATVSVRGRYVANHSGVRLEGALAHLGIACLPLFTARAAIAEGRLLQVLPDWDFRAPAYRGTAWLLYPPKRHLAPKVRVLIDYLATQLAQ